MTAIKARLLQALRNIVLRTYLLRTQYDTVWTSSADHLFHEVWLWVAGKLHEKVVRKHLQLPCSLSLSLFLAHSAAASFSVSFWRIQRVILCPLFSSEKLSCPYKPESTSQYRIFSRSGATSTAQ